jgi:SAM-dependent methyltransferase
VDVFGRLRARRRPAIAEPVLPAPPYSSHLTFDSSIGVAARVIAGRRGDFLDVGGRSGEFGWLARGMRYHVLDIDPSATGRRVITADICHCPELPDESFDVVFSNNTYEHLAEPWLAAEESARLLRRGGLVVTLTCFAWRYHPVPADYWRFTHSALEHLFERAGLTTIASGYDLRARRDNKRGGKLPGGLDLAPVDELGGWRENWIVFHVGEKPS